MTVLIKCVNPLCESEFQDTNYTKGGRVANTNAKGCKCTVCGKQYTESEFKQIKIRG